MNCQNCGHAISADARFCGVCGQPVAISSHGGQPAPVSQPGHDMTGRVIAGRYRLLDKLGEGGMGAVFRAEQLSLKRVVALKLLRPALSDNDELVRRFNAEAEMAARLSHPNTVTLYDFGQDSDGMLFIAMELIAGQSLRQTLGQGPMPLARIVAIADQICDSLGDAHQRGIVHRDLKPDNVMLSERGSKRDIVCVLDFGIAKLRDQRGDVTGVPITQAGALLGTPQYMAPEQIRGETVDGRADIYALGIILYEMLTGALPFEAPSLMAILSCHLLDTPIPPSQRRPDLAVPPAVEQLIMTMLSKAPGERPSSMYEVARQLAEIAGARSGQMAHSPDAHQASLSVGPAGPMPVGPAMTPAPPGAQAPVITAPPVSTPLPVAPTAPAIVHTPAPAAPAHPGTPAPASGVQLAVAFTGVTGKPPDRARKSRKGRWLALFGVLLIGGGVAAFFIHRARTTGSAEDETLPSVDNGQNEDNGYVPTDFYVPPTRKIFDDSPGAGSGGSGGATHGGSGNEFVHPQFGYGLSLPPGFVPQPSEDPNTTQFFGMYKGVGTFISATKMDFNPDDMSDADLLGLTQIITGLVNGELDRTDFREIQGDRRITGILDQDELGLRFQFAILPCGDGGMVIAVGNKRRQFRKTRKLRKKFFEEDVDIP